MILWVIFALMALAVVAGLVLPLLRRSAAAPARADYDLQVYRDQLEDLKRDLDRGVVTEAEERSARLEIERRLLKVADQRGGAAAASGGRRFGTVLVLAIAVPVSGLWLYLQLGSPDLPSQPLASRDLSQQRVAGGELPPDMAQIVERLVQRLEEVPEDYRGWTLLGRTYMVTRRYDDAIAAYRRAIALPEAETDSTAHSALG
ncbi:MAG: c-type cytochrome biogenesis protein CcmI, partial [Minwuiales bacterium]|nr:c-type cytochrome biogenesis protein CcmI [Minwuiales bacterium]